MVQPVILLGRKLDGNKPSGIYESRLHCVASHIQTLVRGGLEWKLIISGGMPNGNPISEADAGFAFLIDRYPGLFRANMDGREIFLDRESIDTFGNVINPLNEYLPLVADDTNLDVVTSDYHLPRALWCFGYLLNLPRRKIKGICPPSFEDASLYIDHISSESRKLQLTELFLAENGVLRGEHEKAARLLRENGGYVVLDPT